MTAVDSAPKLEMLRTIGADRVINYSQEDFIDSPCKSNSMRLIHIVQ